MTAHPAGANYVVTSQSSWGSHAAIVHDRFYKHFMHTARGIGFGDSQIRRQWNILSQIAAPAGQRPNMLSSKQFGDTTIELTALREGDKPNIPIS